MSAITSKGKHIGRACFQFHFSQAITSYHILCPRLSGSVAGCSVVYSVWYKAMVQLNNARQQRCLVSKVCKFRKFFCGNRVRHWEWHTLYNFFYIAKMPHHLVEEKKWNVMTLCGHAETRPVKNRMSNRLGLMWWLRSEYTEMQFNKTCLFWFPTSVETMPMLRAQVSHSHKQLKNIMINILC